MRLILYATLAIFSLSSWAQDITPLYHRYYSDPGRLTKEELRYLSARKIILIPGILSEVFSAEDSRGQVDFSRLSSDYFASQVHHLRHNLKLPTEKLLSSSRSVAETKIQIARALEDGRRHNRKVLLISHSLGGLALLDHLLESDESDLSVIEGIIFMQTPFHGSPIATVFLDDPYNANRWLKPFLPFFNTSMETIEYLSVERRTIFMKENQQRIESLLKKIPVITMSGWANGDKSLFTPAVDVMKHGCLLNKFGRCLSNKLFMGPYDLSDGMVPLNSSRLPYISSVTLEGIDHGEPIVKLPLERVNRETMTETLIKLLLSNHSHP